MKVYRIEEFLAKNMEKFFVLDGHYCKIPHKAENICNLLISAQFVAESFFSLGAGGGTSPFYFYSISIFRIIRKSSINFGLNFLQTFIKSLPHCSNFLEFFFNYLECIFCSLE